MAERQPPVLGDATAPDRARLRHRGAPHPGIVRALHLGATDPCTAWRAETRRPKAGSAAALTEWANGRRLQDQLVPIAAGSLPDGRDRGARVGLRRGAQRLRSG